MNDEGWYAIKIKKPKQSVFSGHGYSNLCNIVPLFEKKMYVIVCTKRRNNPLTWHIHIHSLTHIYIYHHHHVVPPARISLTISRHFSLSFIASGRSSELHPVSSHSKYIYIYIYIYISICISSSHVDYMDSLNFLLSSVPIGYHS